MSARARIARGAFASPVLADLDGDGRLDVIQAAFDGTVHAFDAGGGAVRGFPVEVHYTGPLAEEPARSRLLATPAVADFNGDALPDLLVGSSERLGENGEAGAVYVIDARGTTAPAKMAAPPATCRSDDLAHPQIRRPLGASWPPPSPRALESRPTSWPSDLLIFCFPPERQASTIAGIG